MTNNAISIRNVSRITDTGDEESLSFQNGVNVIVGPPNTGKSVWLTMIDFLLGDTGNAQSSFGEELADKYCCISGTVRIGAHEYQLERRWKERGFAGSVLVDNEKYSADEFSDFLLDRLGFPILHFPKGDPYSPKRWPVLSWRSLLRHIYRQWRFWGDLADQQPHGDQLACLLMFLGVAELVYPKEYEQLVQKNKERLRLEAAKDEFSSIFAILYKQIVEGSEATVSPTSETFTSTTEKITQHLEELQARRDELLHEIVTNSVPAPTNEYFTKLSSAWEDLQVQRDEVSSLLSAADKRHADLLDYRADIESSLRKLNRAMSASEVLADIQITICPACDQTVSQDDSESGTCFLCHQSLDTDGRATSAQAARLQFEIDQLSSENEEADNLVAAIVAERDRLRQDFRLVVSELESVERQMEPLRRAAAGITPPELRELDFVIGRLHQQLTTLDRLKSVLDQRDDRSAEIDGLTQEIEQLESAIAQMESTVSLEQRSQVLADAMNNYLGMLNEQVPNSWTQESITLRVRQKTFEFRVGDRSWRSQLGGTLTHYFLLSYHFGLLSLTNKPGFRYPGFLMLDFPPALEDAESIADKENFVLTPFVSLFNQPSFDDCQVIAAGAAFEDLEGAHRLPLSFVWK
jgi:predicted  nucleic acid-binding Zn-ribbon protein